MVLVFGIGADNMSKCKTLLGEIALHDLGSLNLFIFFAGVGHERQIEEVACVFSCVVPAPELLLVPRTLVALLFKILILACLGKACTGGGPSPLVGEVGRDVPGGCAAHRETADKDAVAVDAIVLLDGIESLEEIHFSSEFGGVAIATVEMEHDGIGRCEFAGTAHAFTQEVHFVARVASPGKPGIEPPGSGVGGSPAGRDYKAVRLNAAIDL